MDPSTATKQVRKYLRDYGDDIDEIPTELLKVGRMMLCIACLPEEIKYVAEHDLEDHGNNVHRNLDEKCQLCKMRFESGGPLAKHQQNLHGK